MAKKGKDEDIDDFGLDDMDDMDFSDFDDPATGGSGSKPRSPVMETANTIQGSVKDALLPPGQRDRIILDAMPKTATPVYEGYREVEDALSDVYSHTKEELVKTRRGLKTQTKQLIPTMKKYLPDSITEKVATWAKSEDESTGPKYDPQQAMMERGIADVFGEQQAEQQQQKNEEEVKDRTESEIKETVQGLKQNAMHQTLMDIASSTSQHYGLARTININWQRKMLELQYQHLFTSQEILLLTRNRFERDTPALEAIMKNTALPDYAKEEFGEIQWGMAKRNMAEWLSPARFAEDFLGNMRENAKKKVSETLGEGRNLLSVIAGGLQEEEDFDMEDTSAPTADSRNDNLVQKGIGIGAGALAKKYIVPQRDRLTAYIREHLEENEGLDKTLNRAQYSLSNMSRIANSAVKEGTDNTVMGGLFKTLNDWGIAPSYTRETVGLKTRDATSLEAPAKFDNRSWLTINEVIPSWLSKINSSILKTIGIESSETYDLTARSFVDEKVIGERVRSYIGADDKRERVRKRIDDVTTIAVGEDGLDSKQREDFGRFLESRISENLEFNVEALLKDDTVLSKFMDNAGREKVREALSSKSTNGEHADKLSNKINSELNPVGASIDSYQKRLSEMVAQYGDRAILSSGIVNYDRASDKLVTDDKLTDVYKDVGKLVPTPTKPTKPEPITTPERKTSLQQTVRGLSPEVLRNVLYGATETNFVNLLGRFDKEDSKATDGTTKVVDAIIASSTKSEIKTILNHIKSMDEEGVIMLVGDSSAKDPTEGEGKSKRKRKSKRRRVRMEDSSLIKRAGGVVYDTGAAIGSGLGKLKDGLFNAAKSDKTAAGKAIRGAGGFVKDGVMSGFRGIKSFGKAAVGARDIYDANGKVVLSGERLKNGDYFKKVKDKLTPIRTIEDLNNATAVYTGDGNIALSEAQLKDAGKLSYYVSGRFWKLTEVIGGGAGTLVNKAAGIPKSLAGALDGKVQSIGKFIKGAMINYPDMYVAGEKEPRIRGNFLRDGKYRIVGGSVIRKPSDITGAVENEQGQVIISAAEVGNPEFKLVDRWGRTVKTRLGRLAGRVMAPVNLARKVAVGAFDKLRKIRKSLSSDRTMKDRLKDNVVTRLFKRGKDKVKKTKETGWFRNNSFALALGFRGANTTNEILARIYRLLNKRMDGEPEDEEWLDSSTLAGRGVSLKETKEQLDNAKAKAKDTYGKVKEKAEQKVADVKSKAETVKSKVEEKAEKHNVKGRASEAKDKLKRYVKGNRTDVDKEIALRLLERKGDTADVYRDQIAEKLAERKGGLKYKLKKKARASKAGLLGKTEKAKGALEKKAKGLLSSRDENLKAAAWSMVENRGGVREHYREKIAKNIKARQEKEDSRFINRVRGKSKFSASDGKDSFMGKQFSQMNEAMQGMWFTQMRSSAKDEGMSDGRLRGLMNRFGKRVKFDKKSEGNDYFKFFRGKRDRQAKEKVDKVSPFFGKKKTKGSGFRKVDAVLAGIGAMLGGLPGAIAGALVRTLAGKAIGGVAGLAAKGVARLLPAAVGATGSISLASTGAALAGAAGTAASAVGAGVAAIGGLPVIAAAVVVGGAAWYIYQKTTEVKAKYLDKLRLAQYGLDEYELWSTDEAAKIRYLEVALRKYTAIEKNDQAILRGLTGEEATKLGTGYGIKADNQKELIAFHAYLQQRFIPIYLNYLSAIRKLESAPPLEELGNTSKVSKKEMQKAFNLVKLPADHFAFKQTQDARKADRGWFKSATDYVGITTDQLLSGEDVEEVTAEVGKEIDDLPDVKKAKGKGSKAAEEVIANTSTQRTFEHLRRREKLALTARRGEKYAERAMKKPESERLANRVGKVKADVKTLNAMQGLRMKAYGLTAMEPTQVKLLLALEEGTKPFITKDGAFKGSVNELIAIVNPAAATEGEAQYKLRYWFINRFLPVYSTYVTAVARYLPAADPNALVMGGAYLMDIAVLVVQAKKLMNGRLVPVWSVNTHPFGEEPNLDSDSAKEELATLKVLTKSKDLNVDNVVAKTKLGKIKLAKKYGKAANQGKYETDVSELQSGVSGTGEDAPGKSAGGYSPMGTLRGAPVPQVEAGEGDYKSVKEKGGEDIPTIIKEAAKVVGIDPLLLLTIAMAESSLNPSAKPKYGKALGLMQFMPPTWKDVVKRYGNKYGIPEGASREDPAAAAILGAAYLKQNSTISKKNTGKEPSAVDYYMPYFLGPGHANSFYKNLAKDPNGNAAAAMPKPAKYNPNIFFKGGKGGKSKTFAEIYAGMRSKLSASESSVKQYAPGASGITSNSVKEMFKDLPAANDAKRDKVVANKAARDYSSAKESAGKNSVPSPASVYESSVETPPSTAPAMEAKAENFANKDNVSEADRRVYREAVVDKRKKEILEEEAAKPKNNTAEDKRTEILSKQLTAQVDMANELVHIREVLVMIMEGATEREIEQQKLNLQRADSKKPKLEVDHTRPTLSHKRVSNL